MSPEPVVPRSTPDRLWPGWDAKSPESLRKKPLYRRGWFVRLVAAASAALLLLAAVGSIFIARSRRERAAELARQQRGLEAFLQSRDFAAFKRSVDAQLLTTLNFIAAHPVDARNRLAEVVAWEDAHHAAPWTDAVSPLPTTTPPDSARIVRTAGALGPLLTQRGFVFDEQRRMEGRKNFLRLLAPQVENFVAFAPEKSFPLLHANASLQDAALAAFGAKPEIGLTVSQVEELFSLEAALGPTPAE